MRKHHVLSRRKSLFALAVGVTLLSGLSVPFTPVAEAVTVASGAVELSPTPPNDTQAVAPNIMVTFDDSGSMANDYMGDDRPYDNKSWNQSGSDPWRCAGVIDPRITDSGDLRSHAMNGVYYNPNVLYSPPANADGTSFLKADATLQKVWKDGVTANRPNNPSGSGSTQDFTGTRTKNRYGNYTDNRWTCSADGSSPLDNDGGPYYYRLKKDVDIGTLDSPKTGTLYNSGNWEAVAVTNTNVVIDGKTVNQYQNWANWWAYYHTRNLMARSSISRVFGALGGATTDGGYGSTIRVAWQNLNDKTFKLPTAAIISELADTVSCKKGADADPSSIQQATDTAKPPPCYRSAFFNWIFQTAASGGTPSVDAAGRAGAFFQRGVKTDKSNLRNPYWQAGKISPDGTQAAGTELYCRQNFHMLVTDGLWNENSYKVSSLTSSAGDTIALPDGTSFVPGASYNAIFGVKHASSSKASLSDVAFNYWATDLRPDLYKPTEGKFVPPYMPDKTMGVVTTSDVSAAGLNNVNVNNELYFNPKNDPANWPHLVQYMVGLGVSGELNYSDDTDCDSSTSDACKLRKGSVGWPAPSDPTPGIAANIDDTWHAAIASRGSFFNAGNPKDLVDQLSAILTNITARSAPASTGAVNTSVLVPGALGFSTGYSSADWSGTFQAVGVNADGTTTTTALWDAGNILDDDSKTDPAARKIFTAKESAADGSFNGGVDFKTFSAFDSAGKTLLSGSPKSSGDDDTGQARVNYLRGDRTNEGTLYRERTTLLGAIINSQPIYVSYPSSGYRNSWPTGSPEQKAIAADADDCADSSSCSSYEYFVKNHLARTPTVYVGANDGMLHAFNAASEDVSGVIKPTADAGKELFAYVPRATYANLGNLTNKSFKFLPTVDGIPVTRDVFFGSATTSPVATDAGWHTMLVGGLRLGGRGVYALDITDPTAMSASKVLWEFSADQDDQGAWTDGTISNPGGKPSDLGYTFGQPNIARLNTGKWVVLVPGGYFPDCSKPPYDSSNCSYPAAASNKFSSLFVLDAQTGKLIRELKTPEGTGAVASHGLSSPVLGDYNDDQIDDVAFAGDLDGNLWRYDLTSSDPSSWTVSLAYQPATVGAQPITSMPRLFGDPATNKFIVVFGTGKYLGASDNTSGSAAVQAVYGIRDLGSTVQFTDLVKQTLSEKTATDGKTVARGLTNLAVPSTKGGWYFNLSPSTSSAGERVVVTPGALFDTGRVIIQTLIPGTNDPCSATIQGALMVLNAATGGSDGGLTGPSVSGWGGSDAGDTSTVGGRVNNPRTGGSVPLVSTIGGGTTLVPGLKLSGSGDVLNINDAIWRRRSWRALNNDQ